MKSIVLIIWATLPSGYQAAAPATYFDTEAECKVRMEKIMKVDHKPLKVVAFCAKTVEEVEE